MNSKKSPEVRILLVDDSEDFVRAAKVLLRDFNVTFASDGLEALKIIEEDKPDILIADLVMPKMSGLELIKKVKEDYPDIIIAALTAIDEEETLSECMSMGVTDYLIKGSLTLEQMKQTIGTLLEKVEI